MINNYNQYPTCPICSEAIISFDEATTFKDGYAHDDCTYWIYRAHGDQS